MLGNPVAEDRLSHLARRLIDRIEAPTVHEGQTCEVSASIGIAIVDAPGLSPKDVLEQADVALYASKRAGRAQFSFYTPEAESGAQAIGGQK